jgi:hypothetical protein
MISIIKSLIVSLTLLSINPTPKEPSPRCFGMTVERTLGTIRMAVDCNNPTGFAIVKMDKYVGNRIVEILFYSDHPFRGVLTLGLSEHDQKFYNVAIKELP